MVNCPGCGSWFHHRGYLNHLRQTHKPECRAILAHSFGGLPDSDSDIDEPHLILGAGSPDVQGQGSHLGRHSEPPDDGRDYWQSGGEGGGAHEEEDKSVDEEGGADVDQGKTDDEEDGEEEDPLYDGDEYWEPPVPEKTGMEMDADEPHTGQQGEPELYEA
jgi:hypothetical protein